MIAQRRPEIAKVWSSRQAQVVYFGKLRKSRSLSRLLSEEQAALTRLDKRSTRTIIRFIEFQQTNLSDRQQQQQQHHYHQIPVRVFVWCAHSNGDRSWIYPKMVAAILTRKKSFTVRPKAASSRKAMASRSRKRCSSIK